MKDAEKGVGNFNSIIYSMQLQLKAQIKFVGFHVKRFGFLQASFFKDE